MASLSRRFAASLIDALLGVLALAGLIAAGVGADALYGKRRGSSGLRRRLASRDRRHDINLASRPVKLTLQLLSLSTSLLRKERRSPGYRILGLRLVDLRTGGQMSRRQELTRTIVRQAWRTICRALINPPKPRVSAEHEWLASELEDARQRHRGDEDALQREMIRIYQGNKVQGAPISCLPVLARPLLVTAVDLPAFWSPLKQSLPDRLAGVAIVHDSD